MGTDIDIEYEKKKNIRLALGVASIGVLGFFILYAVFFLIMFFSPWALFGLLPSSSFSEEVAGLGGDLLIFSKEFNFKRAAYGRPPEENTILRIYNGQSLSEPEEIKTFDSLYTTGDKIYFFKKGLYRTFDLKKWEEFKSSAIGSSPKGAVGTDGIWVLSKIKSKPVLNFITEKKAKEVSLPEDGLAENLRICSTQLLSVGNELNFFFKNDDSLSWYRYDGKKWIQSEQFEDSGDYKAIFYKNQILLLISKVFVENAGITLRVYNGSSWSEPKTIDIRGVSIKIIPAIFRGAPIIFQQGFFSENYYVLNGEQITGPYRISKPFLFSFDIWKVLFVTILSTAIFIILVFLLSILIRKFKLKTWKIDSTEYEFASLFRRFLAKFIDSILITIPVSIPLYFALKEENFLDNPFRLVALTIFSSVLIISGSFFYHSILEGLWGKTIGKLICGIVVLKDDFTKCNIWRGFLRNFMRIIDAFFYYLVAVVTMAGTMKWQRLGDLAAGTIVVRERIKKV